MYDPCHLVGFEVVNYTDQATTMATVFFIDVSLPQQHYGSYLEEQWCQIYLPDGGVAFFNKLTGILQYGGRPDNFRPNLKVTY